MVEKVVSTEEEKEPDAPGLPSPEVRRRIEAAAGKGKYALVRAVTATGLQIGVRLKDGKALVYEVDPELDPRQIPWCWENCALHVEAHFGKARRK